MRSESSQKKLKLKMRPKSNQQKFNRRISKRILEKLKLMKITVKRFSTYSKMKQKLKMPMDQLKQKMPMEKLNL
jgi:hypothetical protein